MWAHTTSARGLPCLKCFAQGGTVLPSSMCLAVAAWGPRWPQKCLQMWPGRCLRTALYTLNGSLCSSFSRAENLIAFVQIMCRHRLSHGVL